MGADDIVKTLTMKMMEVSKLQTECTSLLLNLLEGHSDNDYVSLQEACRFTGKSTRQIRYLCDTGRVRYRQISEKIREYSYSDLKKYKKNMEEVKVG